jgi:hypothetical protein
MEYQTKTKDDSALRALEARQKEVERSITNLMTAIEQGIITPTTKSRLVELEADHERINKAIAKEVIKNLSLSAIKSSGSWSVSATATQTTKLSEHFL